MRRRAVGAAAALATAAGAVLSAAPPASAGATTSHVVYVVKDQTGGGYYNVTTGARFDVVAAAAAPNFAILALQVSNGLILTSTGVLLARIDGIVSPTPAAAVVAVAATTAIGTYESAVTGVVFTVQSFQGALPPGYDAAIEFTTGEILTINNELLVPIQKLIGANG